MPAKKPVVALIYDFDGTLSPLNMQEYDFLKAIGIKDRKQFWAENDRLKAKHNASNVLCYMRLMLEKARAAHVSVKREQFVEFGRSVQLYKGVEQWFDLINALGNEYGIKVEHDRRHANSKVFQGDIRLFVYVRRRGGGVARRGCRFHRQDAIPFHDK